MILMSPPRADTYQGSVVLSCRILATDGRGELVKFANTCGFPRPVFSREGRYDEHIKVSGRRIIEKVIAEGATQTPTEKNFNKILRERKPK